MSDGLQDLSKLPCEAGMQVIVVQDFMSYMVAVDARNGFYGKLTSRAADDVRFQMIVC